MPDLFSVVTRQEAWQRLQPHLSPSGGKEKIAVEKSLGRVLAEDIIAGENLPSFPRSAMDGYAVRAEDTYGALESLPVCLKVVGEIPVGCSTDINLSPGEVALVHTGGVLSQGANAVVMVENTQQVDASTIEVVRPVAVGENVLQVGEDIRQGEKLFEAGHLLRAPDMGALVALGIAEAAVFLPAKVALISSGDELVPPCKKPQLGQVRDINTYTLSALTLRAGGIPLSLGIVADDYEALRKAAERGMEEGDIVVISAGSSVSTRDMTAQVIASLGKPGILVHGIAIKPGKPTILAVAGGKPVFGLPGNPVSAMVIFDLFVAPAIRKLSGCSSLLRRHTLEARTVSNIPSASGREDYVPVRLKQEQGETWAEPIFGQSSFISTLVKADGFLCVPLDKAGLEAGERVTIAMF